MNKVVDVRPLENYRIWLRFGDGLQGEIDLSDLVGRGVFAVWSDPELFRAVHVEEGGGIEWTEEADMCPDALYLRPTGKAVDDIFPEIHRFSARCSKIVRLSRDVDRPMAAR